MKFKAVWELKNGSRVQSREFLTLEEVGEYTFEGEKVVELRAQVWNGKRAPFAFGSSVRAFFAQKMAVE